MSLPACEQDPGFYKTSFQNCITNNKNPNTKGKNLIKHCCEMISCTDPQIIDPRCWQSKTADGPHFGDIRPEAKHNPKFSHKGIGVL